MVGGDIVKLRNREGDMKKIILYSVLFFTVLVFFIGCSSDVVENGVLRLAIDSRISKGIQPISMEVLSYKVMVKDSSGDAFFDAGGSDSYYEISLPVGSYTIVVDALNKDGYVIGTGSSTAKVNAGKAYSVSIHVSEIQGKGKLSLSAYMKSDPGLIATIYKYVSTEESLQFVASKTFNEIPGDSSSYIEYKSEFELDNGFYCFEVKLGDSVVWSDTMRIISNTLTSDSKKLDFEVKGNVAIVNDIVDVPSITFETSIMDDGSLVVKAKVEGMVPNYYKWVVDGVEKESSKEYMDYVEDGWETSDEGMEFVFVVADETGLIWSDKTIVNKRYEGLHGWYYGEMQTEGWRYFFEITEGCINVSFYRGRKIEFNGDYYKAEKLDDGYRLIWKSDMKSDMNNDEYCLWIPKNKNEQAKFYYDWNINDHYHSLLLEKLDSAPNMTKAYIIYDETRHIEADVFRDQKLALDTYGDHDESGENGKCSVCGFDKNNSMFGVWNDLRFVESGFGYINVLRYWPDELMLGNGINAGAEKGFFVQRIEGHPNDNYYNLYYPSEVYDLYLASGGGGDASDAFEWYLRKFYPTVPTYLWGVDVEDVLDVLIGTEYISPNVDENINTSRIVVSKELDEVKDMSISDYSICAYNKNSLELGDGTPIVEEEGFYYSLSGNASIRIYCPERIIEVYERIRGFRCNPYNSFCAYMHIYYPDSKVWSANAMEILEIILTNEFIEPEIEDYI